VNTRFAVRPRADRDIDEITDHLADEAGLDMALRFLTVVYESIELLTTQLQMGWRCKISSARLEGVRVFPVGAPFERYLVFYELSHGQVEIARVLHGSRDIEEILMRDGID
jgi:toxin ParE1/3/4